ncbi:MAG: mnmE, partial [Clostridiales bacterium]|nr:mnmE [Clostridiales bacterium]
AIVTEIAGTTRDTVEETINISGITLNIIDTAGIRDTKDRIEQMGVEKAIRFAGEADLIIFVIDSSTELDDNDESILELIKEKKVIILLNKTDLKQIVTKEDIKARVNHPLIHFSITEDSGMEELEQIINEMFYSGSLLYNEDIYITNERHKEALYNALESLNMVRQSIADTMPEDFYSIDLMNAYEYLGKIIGENVEEDLVNMIFKEFCMGK